jgi:hypothetical protein
MDLNKGYTGSFNTAQLFPDHSSSSPPPILFPTTLDPEIRIEITDPMVTGTVGGNATDGQAQQVVRTCTVTVTAYGETLPSGTVYGGAALEVGRSRISFLSYNDNCQ